MGRDLTFALDIGTRTVIGVVGEYEGENFKVLDCEVIEHKSRAMMDGQIHDVEAVAQVASEVKENLEKRLGIKLQSAAIAAAGRVLKTRNIKLQTESDPGVELTKEMALSLEMEAIQKGHRELDEESGKDEKGTYYCVGYSVIKYYLNNYEISSIVGHRGESVGVDLIATFLPQTVVDSLYSVLRRAGLDISSMTLEPIAAINAAIPKEIRLLNLALVDIGAGTSDIAITKGGSVVAYGMVPMAGDEITEAIAENLLVGFNDAEKIKINLSKGCDEITYTDVLGLENSISAEALMNIISPFANEIAEAVTSKIIELNQRPPAAVFLVGGGSQLKGLSGLFAQKLSLMPQRVGVKGRETVQNLIMEGDKLLGPEAITPLGIATTAHMETGHNFINVHVNQSDIRLFKGRRLTVGDALAAAGIEGAELIPSRGSDLTFILNNKKKTVKGDYGNPAEIIINSKNGNLQDEIAEGDKIIIKPAVRGTNAVITVKDIMDYYCDKSIAVYVNGNQTDENFIISEGDEVEVFEEEQILEVSVEDDTDPLLELPQEEPKAPEESKKDLILTVNGERIILKYRNSEYIFVDIFNFIDMDLSRSKGRIMLKLNGRDANYTDVLQTGDVIEVYWQS